MFHHAPKVLSYSSNQSNRKLRSDKSQKIPLKLSHTSTIRLLEVTLWSRILGDLYFDFEFTRPNVRKLIPKNIDLFLIMKLSVFCSAQYAFICRKVLIKMGIYWVISGKQSTPRQSSTCTHTQFLMFVLFIDYHYMLVHKNVFII